MHAIYVVVCAVSIWLATLQLIVFARTLLVLIKTSRCPGRYPGTSQLFSQGRRDKTASASSGLSPYLHR